MIIKFYKLYEMLFQKFEKKFQYIHDFFEIYDQIYLHDFDHEISCDFAFHIYLQMKFQFEK